MTTLAQSLLHEHERLSHRWMGLYDTIVTHNGKG